MNVDISRNTIYLLLATRLLVATSHISHLSNFPTKYNSYDNKAIKQFIFNSLLYGCDYNLEFKMVLKNCCNNCDYKDYVFKNV